jgi:hypothetical protein
MIADIVVIASMALIVAFVTGWLVSSRLRTWIEQPKHRFQDALQQYDVAQHRQVMIERSPRE